MKNNSQLFIFGNNYFLWAGKARHLLPALNSIGRPHHTIRDILREKAP